MVLIKVVDDHIASYQIELSFHRLNFPHRAGQRTLHNFYVCDAVFVFLRFHLRNHTVIHLERDYLLHTLAKLKAVVA